MAEYINREPNCKNCIHDGVCYMQEVCNDIDEQLKDFGCDDFKPTADVVEVVRCKDCIHFQPDFVLTNNGERRPYTEEEKKAGKFVTAEFGINCASRCERFGYWEDNRIPVWFSENDFCSYGEKMDGKGDAE